MFAGSLMKEIINIHRKIKQFLKLNTKKLLENLLQNILKNGISINIDECIYILQKGEGNG